MIVAQSHRFDGTQRLFQIGLKPLEAADWIDVDARLGEYLEEKQRLRQLHPDEVFAAEPGTEAAQAELLALLVEHLPARFPQIYRRDGDTMQIAEGTVSLAGDAPLRIAASLVQEDLLLMRRGPENWRLAAASLSFPSSWRLGDKFGKPIHDVHAPVPGFGHGSRNAELIARMFDTLRPDSSMLRWNWSLYGDAELFHPQSGTQFGELDALFLRAERQTLRKLPVSGDIVFTIRIYVDPLAELKKQKDAPAIAARLAAQLEALSAEQLAYKGLVAARDGLLARLAAYR